MRLYEIENGTKVYQVNKGFFLYPDGVIAEGFWFTEVSLPGPTCIYETYEEAINGIGESD
jgi:hypothetical protein